MKGNVQRSTARWRAVSVRPWELVIIPHTSVNAASMLDKPTKASDLAEYPVVHQDTVSGEFWIADTLNGRAIIGPKAR